MYTLYSHRHSVYRFDNVHSTVTDTVSTGVTMYTLYSHRQCLQASKTVPVDTFVYINMHRKVGPDVGICPEIQNNPVVPYCTVHTTPV